MEGNTTSLASLAVAFGAGACAAYLGVRLMATDAHAAVPPQNVGGDCGWAAVQSRDGGWANATVTIKGTQLVLQVQTALIKGDVVATSYGWGVYAMISTYTAAEVAGGGGGIPVLPWNKTL